MAGLIPRSAIPRLGRTDDVGSDATRAVSALGDDVTTAAIANGDPAVAVAVAPAAGLKGGGVHVGCAARVVCLGIEVSEESSEDHGGGA